MIRFNRSNEFDKMDDTFVRFLMEEILPDVEKQKSNDGRQIYLSKDANDRAIAGASSGAICAFTAAWERPDSFSRIFSAIGTYVAMRGGNEYPDQPFGGTYLAIYPNHHLLMQTEKHSQWIYSSVIDTDGSVKNGQRFYWLHNTDNLSWTENGKMTFDVKGNLYVATEMGIQVCDQNGRVRAILSLPTGPITSLVFGGKHHDVLYIISGGKLFSRKMNVQGTEPWMSPIDPASQGAG